MTYACSAKEKLVCVSHETLEKYGAVKGLYKGIKRLSKCNDRGDGTRGGYDYP